jgi:hypothetical protein
MKRSFVAIAALLIVTVAPPMVDTADAIFCNLVTFVRPDGTVAKVCRFLDNVFLFDSEATLSPNGRTVTASVTVPPCEPIEKTVQIAAAIVQDSIQTSAQGAVEQACAPSGPTRLIVPAVVPEGKPAFFEEEPVRACAVLFTRGAAGQILDIKQWCSFPTLVTE